MLRQRRSTYWPDPMGPLRAKHLERHPESVGKIVMLDSGRFGALSPRGDDGRRRPLGAFDTAEQADDRLRSFRELGKTRPGQP